MYLAAFLRKMGSLIYCTESIYEMNVSFLLLSQQASLVKEMNGSTFRLLRCLDSKATTAESPFSQIYEVLRATLGISQFHHRVLDTLLERTCSQKPHILYVSPAIKTVKFSECGHIYKSKVILLQARCGPDGG